MDADLPGETVAHSKRHGTTDTASPSARRIRQRKVNSGDVFGVGSDVYTDSHQGIKLPAAWLSRTEAQDDS